MQDNRSLFRTQNRGPVLGRPEAVPVRRLVLRGDRNYLRALRAAEMAAWENARPAPRPPARPHSRRRGVRLLPAFTPPAGIRHFAGGRSNPVGRVG